MSYGEINHRHGVSNVHVALQTSTGSYGTPWIESGIESVTPSTTDQSVTKFHSENRETGSAKGAKGGYSLALQFGELSDKFRNLVLGNPIDSATGGIIVQDVVEDTKIAIGYEVKGTAKGMKVWWFGGEPGEPTTSAHQTDNEGGATEAPDTINVTVNGDLFGGSSNKSYCIICHEGDTGYDNFLNAVPTPSPSSAGVGDVTLASCSLSSVTLAQAFNKNTHTYTGTASGSSTSVTPVATDSTNATITVNGAALSSGSASVSLSTGENVISVVVRNGNKTGQYLFLITKS